MLTKIQKWGNSQGLRIPKTILEEVDIGSEIALSAQIKIVFFNLDLKCLFCFIELMSRFINKFTYVTFVNLWSYIAFDKASIAAHLGVILFALTENVLLGAMIVVHAFETL